MYAYYLFSCNFTSMTSYTSPDSGEFKFLPMTWSAVNVEAKPENMHVQAFICKGPGSRDVRYTRGAGNADLSRKVVGFVAER